MENNNLFLVKRYLARLGIIFTNFAIAGMLFLLGTFLSNLFAILFYVFLIIWALCFLGLPLLDSNYRKLWSSNNFLVKIGNFFSTYSSLLAGITIALIILSIVLMLFDTKWKKVRARFKFFLILGSILLLCILVLMIK